MNKYVELNELKEFCKKGEFPNQVQHSCYTYYDKMLHLV